MEAIHSDGDSIGLMKCNQDGIARKARSDDDNGGPSIAIVPFPGPEPPVHLLDSSGKTFPVRKRSPVDDFKLAVRSLGLHRSVVEGGEKNDSEKRSSVALEDEGQVDTDCVGTGPVYEKGSKDSDTEISSKPKEHPLQKAVTAFDMAIAELNQLIHLVDLARQGDFMTLERVTSPDERKDGLPLPAEGLTPILKVVHTKSHQLMGAADQLRKRARRLRDTSQVQRVFQNGVVQLRKKWQIVAPNHGKVNVPLQVGEALAVDCSFGSAGGTPVPYEADAGMRHKHPWLVQLICGEGGKLEVGPRRGHPLMTLEVQLIEANTGVCQCSAFAQEAWDVVNGTWDGPLSADEGCVSSGCSTSGLDRLCQHLVQVQHSVFWEEVFEAIKAEALVNGKQGWLAQKDSHCSGDLTSGNTEFSPIAGSVLVAGTKRKVTEGSWEPGGPDKRRATTQVVHVMDDEVRVNLDGEHLLGFRLVTTKPSAHVLRPGSRGTSLPWQSCSVPEKGDLRKKDSREFLSLCQLALLYSGSLLRQHHRRREENVRKDSKDGLLAKDLGKDANGLRSMEQGIPVTNPLEKSKNVFASLYGRVGEMLRHYIFQKQVVSAMTSVSRSLQLVNLPFSVHWTDLQMMYPASSFHLTLGWCFHFTARIQQGVVALGALAGLQNPADHRYIGLSSAHDMKSFLLFEASRQIILTFSDIAAGWTKKDKGVQFTVDLVSRIIHLLSLESREETAFDQQNSGVSPESEERDYSVCVDITPNGDFSVKCSKRLACLVARNSSLPVKSEKETESSTHSCTKGGTEASSSLCWELLEGQDIFQKFSRLLSIVYSSPLALPISSAE